MKWVLNEYSMLKNKCHVQSGWLKQRSSVCYDHIWWSCCVACLPVRVWGKCWCVRRVSGLDNSLTSSLCVCMLLCIAICLHSSNTDRWKPANNDHYGDQFKAVIVVGLSGRWRKKDTFWNESHEWCHWTVHAVQNTLHHLMMHKSTAVAVLLGFWNKPPPFSDEKDKLHCKPGLWSHLGVNEFTDSWFVKRFTMNTCQKKIT